MKTFKEILAEIAEPKSPDEKRFKDKHVTAKHDHPAAEEDQFTSDKKKAKRKADLDDEEDEEVYESTEPKYMQKLKIDDPDKYKKIKDAKKHGKNKEKFSKDNKNMFFNVRSRQK